MLFQLCAWLLSIFLVHLFNCGIFFVSHLSAPSESSLMILHLISSFLLFRRSLFLFSAFFVFCFLFPSYLVNLWRLNEDFGLCLTNFSLTCPFIWVSSSCAYNYTDVAHWPRLNFIFAKKYPQIRSDNHKDIMMIDDAVASFSTKFLVEKELIKDHLHHFTTLERKKSVYIKGRLEKRKKRQQNEMLQSRTLTETLFITPKYLSHFNLCER